MCEIVSDARLFAGGHFILEDGLLEFRKIIQTLLSAEKGLYLSEAGGCGIDGAPRYPSRFVFDIEPDTLFFDPPLTDEYKAESLSYIERMEEGLREDASSGIRFKRGDRIRHRVFGEGTVEEVEEAEQSYTIHFDGMMTARKIAFRVKMEKVD